MPDDSSQVIERHLKEEATQLASDIPKIEMDIKSHMAAQKKLYEARDLMEKAMMTLPGASTFLDRQALAGHASSGQQHSLFMKSPILTTMMDITVPSLKDAEKLASEAYLLQSQASKLCKNAVPLIPSSSFNHDDNVISVLTAYRGYRLKVETILRTQLNPRLNKLQSQLAITKYHYEQKTIEWIDQQIIMLEALLRQNGCLENINLDREISILRMGSNAAIVAVAAETSGRVTVDDALEVNQSNAEVERNGVLPEYSENANTDSVGMVMMIPPSSASLSSTPSIINTNFDSSNNELTSPLSPSVISPTLTTRLSFIDTTVPTSSSSAPVLSPRTLSLDDPLSHTHQLPIYSQQALEEDHQRHEYNGPEAPPAYFR
ncbi:hypothetical protein BC941DRAFT_343114 [Chlamydoabsidia padenii]|nr:hypothetical protein BC941DRAFT_343114 [Chlamydoabsidia padenii]